MARTCPRCGASVGETALSCPRCHAALDVTQRMSRVGASWCPVCGALVEQGATACPKCGSSLGGAPAARSRRKLDLPEIGGTGELGSAEATGVMTRIESAIPAADDASSPLASEDRMPRTRSLAFAALLAVLVVGGAALLITHPWDPSASQTRATTPADTSRSGYPGEIKELSGQDVSGGTAGGEDEPAASPEEELAAAHASLGELSERVDESERALRAACESLDASACAEGLEDAQSVSLDVSNLIADVELIDGDETSVENVLTLGSWLRNRCDALTEAWELAASSTDLSADAERILDGADASADYGRLFSERYDEWAPAA